MIEILINSVDRSDIIEQNSVSFSQGVTKQPSTLSFLVRKDPTKTMPVLGDSVLLKEDGVSLFKGTIVEKDDEIQGSLVLGTTITCKDGLHTFDKLLVSKAYSETTVSAVVTDIVNNFATGFTLSIPTVTPSVKSIRFNYEYPSKCLQTIAQQIGWDWYIDASDVVHFFPKGEEEAPFGITDSNGMCTFNSLSFNSNIVELKNSVFLRGGEYLDVVSEADALDKYIADGQQVIINLGYKYNSIQVTVDGAAQTVGTDFIHDPADYDCLYNFQEKLLRFREDNKPAATKVVKAFGNVYIPLIVQAEDSDSVLAYGRFEGIKIDKTITSVLEAEQACSAILEEWGQGSYDGSFRTQQKGLRAGQKININSATFGINDDFKINSITGQMNGHDQFEYRVRLIKSGDINFNDIMIDLLGREKKNLTISDDEVVQRLLKLTDTVGATDELISFVKSTGPYKYVPVAGDLIDSYSEANGDSSWASYGDYSIEAQSFLNPSEIVLHSCKFYLGKTGSPTGNIVARIFAHAGTFGVDGYPDGDELATSDPVDSASLSTTKDLITFEFSGANRITLQANTHYFIAYFYQDGILANHIATMIDKSSPTHAGNLCEWNGTSWDIYGSAGSSWDMPFYIYGYFLTGHTPGKWNFSTWS